MKRDKHAVSETQFLICVSHASLSAACTMTNDAECIWEDGLFANIVARMWPRPRVTILAL